MTSESKIRLLQDRLTNEFFKAFGLREDGWLRHRLQGLVAKPTYKFSALMAAADEAAETKGLHGGAAELVRRLGIEVRAVGAEHIPPEGPLLIASNHPASYDSACIGSVVSRPDLKIIVYETAFYHGLDTLSKLFIMVSPDRAKRFNALREAIQHLQSGGALITFGSGLIEPDPQVEPGVMDSLADWSSSLEAMLRKVPATQVVQCCVSGVVMPAYLRSPLTLARRKPKDKRRIAEFLQVSDMAVRGQPPAMPANITFAPPLTLAHYESMGSGSLVEAVRQRQRALTEEHLQHLEAEGLPVYR